MLPFFETPSLPLFGGLKLEAFGVLSAGGTLIGASLAARAARVYGPGDDTPLREVATPAIVGGLIGGHLVHVLAYHPEVLAQQGLVALLRIWDGLSSMGGVLGALVGIFYFFWRRKQPVRPYLDALALGAAPGWAVARIGCFMAHDHPGKRTDFFLAVDYPVRYYGGPRHDLGLYDALVLIALSAVLYLMARRKRGPGAIMGALALGYSVPRFFLDFLRADDLSFVDARYFGLTPAQYIVMVLAAAGLYLLVSSRGAAPAAPA